MKKGFNYKRFTRSKAGNFFYFSILILAGLFTILPLIYSISTSFKPLDELLAFPPKFFVTRPTFKNYYALPSLLSNLKVPFSRYVFNTLFVSIAITICHVLVASMSAFVMCNVKNKFTKILFWIIQFALLYNATTLAIPQYLIFSELRLIDTYWIYILPYIPSAMGVFLIKQYIHHAFGMRQNKPEGLKLFEEIIERYNLKGDTIKDIYQNTIWLQCEGLKAIFEEARRQWPTCCMAINWFFNEPWKVAMGRSLVLYPNRKKPSLNAVKEALRPVSFSARIPKFDWSAKERFNAELWFLNDTGNEYSGKVSATLEIDGKTYDLGTWETGKQWGNCLGPTVNLILPECDATTLTLRLTAENGMGNEYTLRFYPTFKKDKNVLREMNSTNDL